MSVLLVEDDESTRELLAVLLQRAGAHVTQASDAAAAIKAFDATHPDVVLSDLGLPGKDGMELLREIRCRPLGLETPAIALTAYGQDEIRIAAEAAGFQDFLSKPIEISSLIDALKNALKPLVH